MKRIKQKLENSKGESLPEALVASLIGGMALLVLASMIMVSHRMMDRSNKMVKAFYEEINQIEKQSIDPKNGTVTIISADQTQTQINIKVYKTDKSNLAAYSK